MIILNSQVPFNYGVAGLPSNLILKEIGAYASSIISVSGLPLNIFTAYGSHFYNILRQIIFVRNGLSGTW
jgi:hypothetical protein